MQKWDYADLSKAAKAAGGPEKYVNMLVDNSKRAGKLEMIPIIGAVLVVSPIITVASQRIYKRFSIKIKKNQKQIEIAKHKIISGIKEYDKMYPDEEGGENYE